MIGTFTWCVRLSSCWRAPPDTSAISTRQVGWAYSLVATPLAISLILTPSKELLVNPLYGWAVREGRLSAIATGYFIWDTK